MGFGRAVPLVDDLRAVDVDEVGAGLVGHGAGDEGLAAAGRPVQQHPFGRVDAQPLEDLRVAQRQLDHLADAADLAAQPADVLVGDGAALLFGALRRPGE